jgi:hypothetical protein
MKEEPARHIEVHRVAVPKLPQVEVAESRGEREGVRAVVLEAALVQVRRRVERGVIRREPSDEGEIEPGHTRSLEDGEVRVVRHALVDGVRERAGHEPGSSLRRFADQPAIAFAGLEQNRWSAVAASLEVEDEPHVPRPGVLLDEEPCA